MPRIVSLANLEQFAAVNLLSDGGLILGPKVVTNCIQIVLGWNLAGSKIGHNVLYGRYASPPTLTPAMADSIKAALTTGALWTAYNLHLPPSSGLATVTLRNVNTAENPIVSSTSAATVGTGTTGGMVNEAALVASLKTVGAGPRYRGRCYLAGFQQTEVSAGTNVVAPGLVTDAQAWVATFTAVFSAQGLTWCLGLPARAAYTGLTGRNFPARPSENPSVTAVTVNNRWDSQRRRGLK